jgi:hypothetical protein
MPAQGAAVQGSAMPIVDGRLGTAEDLRGTVAVLAGPELCTGVLVAPDVVLTAAHCLFAYLPFGVPYRRLDTDEIRVVAGALNLEGAEELPVSLAEMNPLYADDPALPDHDIAVLLLEEESAYPCR